MKSRTSSRLAGLTAMLQPKPRKLAVGIAALLSFFTLLGCGKK
jgi:hypothetical protein